MRHVLIGYEPLSEGMKCSDFVIDEEAVRKHFASSDPDGIGDYPISEEEAQELWPNNSFPEGLSWFVAPYR